MAKHVTSSTETNRFDKKENLLGGVTTKGISHIRVIGDELMISKELICTFDDHDRPFPCHCISCSRGIISKETLEQDEELYGFVESLTTDIP